VYSTESHLSLINSPVYASDCLTGLGRNARLALVTASVFAPHRSRYIFHLIDTSQLYLRLDRSDVTSGCLASRCRREGCLNSPGQDLAEATLHLQPVVTAAAVAPRLPLALSGVLYSAQRVPRQPSLPITLRQRRVILLTAARPRKERASHRHRRCHQIDIPMMIMMMSTSMH
jgi:hypothetical protein